MQTVTHQHFKLDDSLFLLKLWWRHWGMLAALWISSCFVQWMWSMPDWRYKIIQELNETKNTECNTVHTNVKVQVSIHARKHFELWRKEKQKHKRQRAAQRARLWSAGYTTRSWKNHQSRKVKNLRETLKTRLSSWRCVFECVCVCAECVCWPATSCPRCEKPWEVIRAAWSN